MNAKPWQVIRAVRGPILLITFGTLMALNHTDKLDFERSWPVLIIVYGIFKLLERLVGRPVPPPWPQPSYTPEYPPPYPAPQPPPQYPQGGAQ